MAASANPTNLKYLLECSICLNRFQDPRVLPCLHSYCLECLKSHVTTNKDTDGTFNCPECREKCAIPEGGVEKFPKNFFVNAMKDVMPASLLQETETPSSPAPVMCKYYSEENASEHGTAVIFCAQCDAHFCQVCSNHHGMFAKDHKVVSVDEAKPDLHMKKTPNCELHQNQAINWYCKTCSLPACSDCMLEKHDGHVKEKLSVTEAAFKLDMLDVSKLAANRIEILQKISADLKANKIKMEEELDQASTDISESADNMCRLIRQSEVTLQGKVKEAREVARKHFAATTEELETARGNSSRLKSSADSLHQASLEQAICTVLQAPIKKQQLMHQQYTPVPSVQWNIERSTTKSVQLCDVNCLGMLDVKTSVESKNSQAVNMNIDAPLKTIKMEYRGERAVLGIAPVHGNLICVAHFDDPYIWVYTNEGKLKEQVQVPGIDSLFGMQVIDNNQGKLAIVGGMERKVHFVSLSRDLEVTQHLTKDVPMVSSRLGTSYAREIIVHNVENRFVVLNDDGQVINDVQVPITQENSVIQCIARTKSGYGICDSENKTIYFTDINGQILQTSAECEMPWCCVQTSWGHVLVADHTGCEVKVFSEAGDFIGNVLDNNGSITFPHYIYVDEEERLMYVVRGEKAGECELMVYKFAPSDLQALPMSRKVVRLAVDVKLAKFE